MNDLSHDGAGAPEGPFNARTTLLITAIGALAFVAILVLGAFAPDLRSGRNGGSHALSNAATGFGGVVRLADATGRNPQIVRSVLDLDNEDLAVITPDSGSIDLSEILKARGPRATLVVLPKWSTVDDNEHPGWVRIAGLDYPQDPESVLAPAVKLKIVRSKGRGEPLSNLGLAADGQFHFLAPGVVQSMRGAGLDPLITTAGGAIVLARVGTSPRYILSDPDLLNNHGMGDERQAKAAIDLLDFLNSTDATSILFDVTANGLGRSRSPLKLAFEAPFLGVTIIIFTALLLAAWQALVRFGSIRQAERAIAFGKAALVDNTAALIRKAGREASLGGRYADLIRERAMAIFQLPPTLGPVTLGARLEALNPRHSFKAAAHAANTARNRDELLRAVHMLNQWLEEAQK